MPNQITPADRRDLRRQFFAWLIVAPAALAVLTAFILTIGALTHG